ncbi:MAG TPA: bifunctional phosphoribosyl-AMP cyclohydrolase/phosphoribosyl-ATP diphosphatase HisIE [Brevundimonas sp.]|nr:bifunctional phosphoribosyl-AMP cyclohydrolase/phosphoribosyl-ATP diphosphatase HisIE [Brevundimonas sp.]
MTLAAASIDPSSLDFDKGGGLIPVVVQDAATLQVLILAWMDRAALDETIASGEATFFSRSRGGRWRKGETSGDRLHVVSLTPDCDADSLLMTVRPVGNACHLHRVSCFGDADAPGLGRLARLEATIAERAAADPAESWTARLLAEGPKRAAQKVGEEGVETALAGAAGDDQELASEAADLVYHLLVLLRARHMVFQDVLDVLAHRAEAARQTGGPAGPD